MGSTTDTIRVLERLRRRMLYLRRALLRQARSETTDRAQREFWSAKSWGVYEAANTIRDEIKKLKEGK